jgi:hypothetical protein
MWLPATQATCTDTTHICLNCMPPALCLSAFLCLLYFRIITLNTSGTHRPCAARSIYILMYNTRPTPSYAPSVCCRACCAVLLCVIPQVLAARIQGSDSSFAPYIANLPVGVSGVPMFFAREALEAIEYPPVVEQVRVQNHFDSFQPRGHMTMVRTTCQPAPIHCPHLKSRSRCVQGPQALPRAQTGPEVRA